MKFLGHPIHVLLIHFPTALLPMDVVLGFLSYYKQETVFAQAGFYCLVAGVLAGYFAMITGLVDLVKIANRKSPALNSAFLHGIINGSLILIFTVFAYKGWKVYPQINLPSMTILMVKSILIIVLFVGNYIGGKLIYTYRVGIKEENG
ncbi:MAG TPA: DUF2231 domain-containing protein [Chitinophagaceae bacterium]|nr:DUF2231 domain-containing protein [Chitinophagaceae bacterium]